jgi:hypothetical protein
VRGKKQFFTAGSAALDLGACPIVMFVPGTDRRNEAAGIANVPTQSGNLIICCSVAKIDEGFLNL